MSQQITKLRNRLKIKKWIYGSVLLASVESFGSNLQASLALTNITKICLRVTSKCSCDAYYEDYVMGKPQEVK